MNTPKLLVLALTAASLMGSMNALQAQTTPAQTPAVIPSVTPAVTPPETPPVTSPEAVPVVPGAVAAPTPTVTAPTVTAPNVTAPAVALPIEPTAAGPISTAPPTAPAVGTSSTVDYSTQRAKPLPTNTTSLRNDRSAMSSAKNERPARADRN